MWKKLIIKKWGISSVGRVIGSQSIGQGFKSPILQAGLENEKKVTKKICSRRT